MNQQVYFGAWKNQREMESSFGIEPISPNIEILFASYSEGCYEGYATVVFRNKDIDQLYLVESSHCSCYGLEGTWEPDLVFEEQLCARNLLYSEFDESATAAYRALWPYKELPS